VVITLLLTFFLEFPPDTSRGEVLIEYAAKMVIKNCIDSIGPGPGLVVLPPFFSLSPSLQKHLTRPGVDFAVQPRQ